jgi:pyruvate-ferredoxin/flavodoxin oxidoreductase
LENKGGILKMASTKREGFPPYRGIETTADGSEAVVWVETHITDAAVAYPITPSTSMAAGYQRAVANGMKNLWGFPLSFIEPESEHSSASVAEGIAAAGGRVTNFTASQGLILMKEVLYTIAGKRLPVVFHIGARALTSQALNIHAGHDDVMGVADTGWGMVFAKNVQEVADLTLIVRRAAEDSQIPYFMVQDGFLTTHTIERVWLPEDELMKLFVGNPREKLRNYIDPSNPIMIGVVENQDSYMKGKIAQRFFYNQMKIFLKNAMEEYSDLTGRDYRIIEPYKLEDAEYAIVALGTLSETAMATVDWIKENLGWKVGVLNLRTFRPFPGPEVVAVLKHLKAFAVIERMDNPIAQSNPVTVEIKGAFLDALQGVPYYPHIKRIPTIYSGSAGLGGRDIRVGDLIAVFDHMRKKREERYFVLGIEHPLALKVEMDPDVRPRGAFSMRGHSVGGFGSVTTNRVIATIIGDLFGLYVQAYPKYGSEKKGLPTTYYLTAAAEPIRTHTELKEVEFVPLNDVNAFNIGNPLDGLREGGIVFLQTHETDPQKIWDGIPPYAKKIIRERKIKVYALDTVKIAKEVATRPDLVQRMQGIVLLGIFLRVTPFLRWKKLREEEMMGAIEKSMRKFFGKAGEQVVKDNIKAVMRGYREVMEIPPSVMEEAPLKPVG